MQSHAGLSTPGTLLSNRECLDPLFPLRSCVSRVLSGFFQSVVSFGGLTIRFWQDCSRMSPLLSFLPPISPLLSVKEGTGEQESYTLFFALLLLLLQTILANWSCGHLGPVDI
jgi:hypothetical protein